MNKELEKDFKECIEYFINQNRNENHIIIADINSDTHKGSALYIWLGTIYVERPFDLNDTNKYEDENYRLVRFLPNYIPTAIKLAINYMEENKRLGLRIYTENGVLLH